MSRFGLQLALAGFFLLPLLIVRAFGLTVSDWLFLASGAIAFIEILRKRLTPRLGILSPIFFCSAIYLAGAVMSSVNQGTLAAIEGHITAGKFFYLTSAWFAICLIFLREEVDVRLALNMWIFGAALSGLAAIAQVLIDPTVVPGTESVWGRSTGFTSHPNDLGASLATAIVPCVGLAMLARGSLFLRMSYFSAAMLIGGGLLASASVSSVISAAVAFIVLIFLSKNVRLALGFGAMILVFLLGALLLLDTYGVDLETASAVYNLTEGEGAKVNTAGSRFDSMAVAIERINEDPLFGVGMTGGGSLTPLGIAVHNIYLGAWYEGGLFAFLSLALLTIYIFLVNRAALRLAGPTGDFRVLVISLVAAQVVFFVYSLASPGLFQRYGWVSVCFLICSISLKDRKSRHQTDIPLAKPDGSRV